MKLDLKIYRSYANERKIVVSGHLFKKNAPDVFQLDQQWYRHAAAVLRMYHIKTIKNATVVFKFKDRTVTTKTLDDGLFKITVPYTEPLHSGWHNFEVTAIYNGVTITEEGEFVKPYPGEYGVISDIDDTFLISHSGRIFKQLYVVLTKNINKRHVFDGVIAHYRLLNQLGRKDKTTNNAFFYVSSSEWNLYNFITKFTAMHNFPKAVLKLKDIKTGITEFIFGGGDNHDHKFYKIKDLVEFYPELHFVLLGDDSQRDPYIYQKICKIFPVNISTVYIRQTGKRYKPEVQEVLANIESIGVKVCYFKNSTEAMKHTQKYLG